MNCIYCNNEFDKATEHVFPKGFGGEDVYVDFVCQNCNSEFSVLERDLLQNSILALPRSIEGIKGYNNKYAFFKPEGLFTLDQANGITIEIGQHDKMEIFYRPQISELNNEFFITGDSDENLRKFNKKIQKWLDIDTLLIVKFLKDEHKNIKYYDIKEDKIVTSPVSTKNAIIFRQYKNKSDLYDYMQPRVFMTDDRSLFLRARTEHEAIEFIKRFISHVKSKKPFSDVSSKIKDNSVNYVEQSFDGANVERAIVKICLNSLLHYFPQTPINDSIKRIIGYVNNGKSSIQKQLWEKNLIIDNQDKTHNIFFSQLNNAFSIRFSMFNGLLILGVTIPEISIFDIGDYYRLVVDYNRRKNTLESFTEIMLSHRKE